MASKMVPGIDYSVTPEAQRIRRERLQPERIVAKLRDSRNGTGGEYAAAIGMIRGTEYLDCGPAERIKLVERILDSLDEITAEVSEVSSRGTVT